MDLLDKEKELIYTGVSVAAGCRPCTSYHFKKAKEAGAVEEELKEVLLMAIDIRHASAESMKEYIFHLLGDSKEKDETSTRERGSKLNTLVLVGAAFAVNCTSTLREVIAGVKSAGVTDEEISEILDTFVMIKEKADLHVSHIMKKT